MSLRPAQQIDDLGGDVINLATSTPVNVLQSDRRAGRHAAVNAAACVCARRSGVRRSVKQNRALAITRDGKASSRTRLAPKAASLPRH